MLEGTQERKAQQAFTPVFIEGHRATGLLPPASFLAPTIPLLCSWFLITTQHNRRGPKGAPVPHRGTTPPPLRRCLRGELVEIVRDLQLQLFESYKLTTVTSRNGGAGAAGQQNRNLDSPGTETRGVGDSERTEAITDAQEQESVVKQEAVPNAIPRTGSRSVVEPEIRYGPARSLPSSTTYRLRDTLPGMSGQASWEKVGDGGLRFVIHFKSSESTKRTKKQKEIIDRMIGN